MDPDLHGRAVLLAAEIHRGKMVKGTDLPYLVHVVRVAAEVLAASDERAHLNRNLAVACALLHDTVEDCEPPDRPMVVDRIRTGFGDDVLRGVLALTKQEELPRGEQMRDSLRRIREQPPEVWMVKMADRIVNLDPPPAAWSPARCREYLEEAGTILEALGASSPTLSRRFERKMEAYRVHIGMAAPVRPGRTNR